MIDTLHIDDLDGAVTLFKSTDEGTETIAVFDEEHREVIEYLAKQVNRFREFWESCKNRNALVYRLDLAHEYINNGTTDIDNFYHWLKEIDVDEAKWWKEMNE